MPEVVLPAGTTFAPDTAPVTYSGAPTLFAPLAAAGWSAAPLPAPGPPPPPPAHPSPTSSGEPIFFAPPPAGSLLTTTWPVREFLRRHAVEGLVNQAIGLVGSSFPGVKQISLEVSQDPDEGAEWIIVRVVADAPPAALRHSYGQFIRHWVWTKPPDKRSLVRLSYRPA